ncbi:MAG: carbohydrate kinase family protein [Armatimonadota bacterium]
MTDSAALDVVAIGSALVEITPTCMGQSLARVEQMVPLPSGAGTNFAIALADLGTRVALLSRVGDDELGQWLIDRLARRGIDTRFVQPVTGQLTPVSFAWMDQDGAKTFYFYRFPGLCDPMGTITPDAITWEQAAAGRVFDYGEAAIRNEPLRSAALRAARLARQAGREVCYAVNYRPGSWRGQSEEQVVAVQRRACATADIALMNNDEARLVSGADALDEAARRIAALGPRVVAITSGDKGALLYAAGKLQQVPARRVKVVYDIGAGDSFHAGFVAAHLAGMPPLKAARFASDAAALRISRAASEPGPTYREVMSLTSEDV